MIWLTELRNKNFVQKILKVLLYTISNGTCWKFSRAPAHQPQVAILAIGAIVKKPAVIETKDRGYDWHPSNDVA